MRHVLYLINCADARRGIFGLSPQPLNFSAISNGTTSYFQSLSERKLIPSLSWSYTAGARYRELFDGPILGGKPADTLKVSRKSTDNSSSVV